MNYFKSTNNQIFAYDDEQVKQGYGNDLITITEQEKDELLAPTPEQLLQQKISEAKAYLSSTDYKMLPNYVTKPDEDLDAVIVKRNETREFIRNNNA